LLDFLLARFYSSNNLLTLELLKGEDLVEFTFELLDKGSFIVVGPATSLPVLAVNVGGLEGVFQAIVVYVVPVVVFNQRLSKLLAKPVRSRLANGTGLVRGSLDSDENGPTSCCALVRFISPWMNTPRYPVVSYRKLTCL
jgi:hypothetical protein